MPVVIDCYNLLHHTMPPGLAGLDERRLMDLLARTPWVSEGITIVCDGNVKPGGPTNSHVPGIDLIYSGSGREADDVILRLIGQNSAPRRLIVVSSDRRLREAATRRRAQAWPAGRFIRELQAVLAASPRPDDPGAAADPKLTDDQVRQWARAFGLPLEDDPPHKPR